MRIRDYLKRLFAVPFDAVEFTFIAIGLTVMSLSIIALYLQANAGSTSFEWFAHLPVIGSSPLCIAFVMKAMRTSRDK